MQFRNDLKRIPDGDGTLNQRSVKLKVSNQNIEGKHNSKFIKRNVFLKIAEPLFHEGKEDKHKNLSKSKFNEMTIKDV